MSNPAVTLVTNTVAGLPGMSPWFTAACADYGILANDQNDPDYGVVKIGKPRPGGIPGATNLLATVPINIVATGNDEYGNAYVKLRFMVGSKDRFITLPRTELFLGDIGIKKLIAANAGVFSKDWPELVKYLQRQWQANQMAIPESRIFTQAGWNDDFSSFVLGTSVLGQPGEVISKANQRYRSAIHPKGTLGEWIKCAKHVVDLSTRKVTLPEGTPAFESHLAEAALACAFAGPLVRLLEARSLLMSIWTKTKDGKSATQSLAASAWGCPSKLKIIGSSSPTFMEAYFQWCRDCYTYIDDTAQAENFDQLKNLGYQFVNGTTKGRGTTTGGGQEQGDWLGSASVSGESPMLGALAKEGAQTRTFELHAKPFPTEEMGEAVHQTLNNTYGHAGPIFIQKLIARYLPFADGKQVDKRSALKDDFKSLLTEIEPGRPSEQLKQIGLLAMACWLMREFVFDEGGVEARAAAVAMGRHLMTLSQSDADVGVALADRAYWSIVEWVLANPHRFSPSAPQGRYGMWLPKEKGVVAILPHALEAFAKNRWDLTQVLHALADRPEPLLLRDEKRSPKDKSSLKRLARLPVEAIAAVSSTGTATAPTRCYCIRIEGAELGQQKPDAKAADAATAVTTTPVTHFFRKSAKIKAVS